MSLSASKRASVAIIAIAQLMAMALWFSASAVVPQLVAEFRLTGFMQSALTSGVQLGFVAGCLVSAFLSLADRLELRRLFAASALLGAGANALLLVVDPVGVEAGAALRHRRRGEEREQEPARLVVAEQSEAEERVAPLAQLLVVRGDDALEEPPE